jgi:hypothetical protein
MSAAHPMAALNTREIRRAELGPSRASMAERPNEKDDQERQLREEYERLLRQLDAKPADSPKPGDVPAAKPENSAHRRG